MKTINAAEANRQFSKLLRSAVEGDEVLILSRGRPVARILPAQDSPRERQRARTALLRRLRAQKPAGGRHWTRDELYRR